MLRDSNPNDSGRKQQDTRRPLREFVGFIWIADEPALRLSVMARSVEEAREKVIAEHGEGHAISLWNDQDASKPRSPGVVDADATCGDDVGETGPPCGAG